MTASVGDLVTPGTHVEIGPGEEVGDGIYISDNATVAIVSGLLVSDSGVISVNSFSISFKRISLELSIDK